MTVVRRSSGDEFQSVVTQCCAHLAEYVVLVRDDHAHATQVGPHRRLAARAPEKVLLRNLSSSSLS